MTTIDQPRSVRDEDRLDAARVDSFLKQHVEGLHGEPSIRQFPGGASNLTYLIAYGDRELVLRKPPAGVKAVSAHDMLREARVMALLKPHYQYVPDILATCEDHAVLGSDFYVMERLRGIILRRDLPPDLGLDESGVRRLCTAFVDRLIDLHRVDVAQADLARIGKGEGYVARQVSGWSDRWRQALTEGTDPCEDVVTWLGVKRPPRESAICLIHNDYRFDNVVLDPDDPLAIVGVLDWEMATLGDPLMDLGGSLAYWVQADDEPMFQSLRRQPTHVAGMFTRDEVIDYYLRHCNLATAGFDVHAFDFFEVFGLFRLMVIIQQIYRRFVLGQTSNPQFAGFGEAARFMGRRCRRLIDASRL